MRPPTTSRTSSKREQHVLIPPPVVLTLILVAGDALSFIVFAAIGRASHGETSGIGALTQVVGTAIPFGLGWFVVAPFVGAYRRELADQPLTMLKRTELAWVIAWPAAMLLRWLFVSDHQSFATFAVVVLITNAILLGGWRTLFAYIRSIASRARR